MMPFQPHPNLSDEINENIARSEIDGGAYLSKLAIGRAFSIITRHRVYTVEHRPDGLYIQGHPKYCPEFTRVHIAGSTWGGSMLQMGFIGIGMCMEFRPESYGGTITTSAIQDVKEIDAGEWVNES